MTERRKPYRGATGRPAGGRAAGTGRTHRADAGGQPPGADAGDDDRTVVLALDSPVDDHGVAACERVWRAVVHERARVVVCDLGGVHCADIGAVGALARLQLVARRAEASLVLRAVPAALRDLIELAGLSEQLPLDDPSVPELGRQPEEREQSLGVEEVADGDDAVG